MYDLTPFGPVRRTITYRGHNNVEFTDIQVGDRTFTVNADTWYDVTTGKEVHERDLPHDYR